MRRCNRPEAEWLAGKKTLAALGVARRTYYRWLRGSVGAGAAAEPRAAGATVVRPPPRPPRPPASSWPASHSAPGLLHLLMHTLLQLRRQLPMIL